MRRYVEFCHDITLAKRVADLLQYKLGDKHEVMGSALTISLPTPLKTGEQTTVYIAYSTTDGCTAIGWLAKECVRVLSLLTFTLADSIWVLDSGKPKESSFHIFSANASPSTRVVWLLCKIHPRPRS